MWDDSTNWIDLTDWTDTDELGAPVSTETVRVAAPADFQRTVGSEAMKVESVSAGEIAATTDITAAVKAGYALIAVFVVENNGEPCNIKGGTTAGGDDWFASTGINDAAVTSISVNKMLSATTDLSMHITVNSGAGFSIDVYMLTTKIL